MSKESSYNWKFCTIGGVTRVKITSGKDIAHLDELDQKLWTVLSCPIVGLEFDDKTLKFLDTNNDGKIRVNEVKAAAKWITSVLKDPDLILKQEDSIRLSAFDQDNPDGLKLYNSAKQILKNLKDNEEENKEEDTGETEEEKEDKDENIENKKDKDTEEKDKDDKDIENKEDDEKENEDDDKADEDEIDDDQEISLAQASDSVAIFAKTALNGDGVITEQSTSDEDLKDIIKSAIETVGSVDDRSGLKGINTELLDKFYTSCQDFKDWKDAEKPEIFPYGDNTEAALTACNAIKEKIADYFMRCKLAAFSKESTSVLDVSTDRIGEISAKDLAASNEEISAYPLARITGSPTLTLKTADINPAWQDAFEKVKKAVLDIAYPESTEITEKQWNDILAKFSDYIAWKDSKKGVEVESLGIEKITKILEENKKADLEKLIADDKALEAESNDIDNVEKFLRYYKNFYKLLKNFVTLTDFYSRDPEHLPVFQAGVLYIDQRSTDLCIKVADMGKQGDVSELSGMYVLYCDCTSKVKNQTMTIAAVLTDGDVDNIRVGKNAVFYDREGHDWDAVITKIIDNPISVRQAFWSPYKKLARFVYDKVSKTASEKNSSVEGNLTAKADAAKIPTNQEDAAAAEAPKDGKVAGFDIAKFAGIFAAIGMAVGFIASALVSLAEGITAKWYNLPLIILAIIVLVSGPSMFLAWLKLRRRNLAPMLNANGWAINSHILVNIPFGATFTSLAKYPKLNLEDPYAPKKMSGFKKFLIALLLIILIGLGVLYFTDNMSLVTDFFGSLKPQPAEVPVDAAPADAVPAEIAPADVPAEAAPAPVPAT